MARGGPPLGIILTAIPLANDVSSLKGFVCTTFSLPAQP